ncbi:MULTISPECIES: (deoxy)nucleoside triphosphate pyrophosphohydrolase [unclassified Sphingobacterium]|uniref:(deoxy)nucleoside triphosphate pyrophosphohydrolase n=1 Tax=unclassified Sphingobacterium TaxID=2609468 RepID=UPI0020C40030|nr:MULTISPECIES: (deoxy)nucleoside triphosphate pyrophosphohydrolase [unclassified Sphingobacterium]
MNVACGIIIKESRILICQRNSEKSLPLKWEFPGGKQEINETLEDCLLREIREELCIELDIVEKLPSHFHKYSFAEITLHPFVCYIKSGRIILNDHLAYKWCNKNEILQYDLADADIPIILNFLDK